MAAINDLISRIQDETLRNRIREGMSKMAKQKNLVWSLKNIYQRVRLYMTRSSKEAAMSGFATARMTNPSRVVLKIENDTAVCAKSEHVEMEYAC